MTLRLRAPLDVRWPDMPRLFASAIRANDAEREASRLRSALGADLVSVGPSIRALFDALLEALDFPTGAMIACSAVNIAQMEAIARRRGLEIEPVDIDPATFYPTSEALENAISKDCRAYLQAHYFGGCSPPGLDFPEHVVTIDDRAQCFRPLDHGTPLWADVTLFSFGPYKSPTAAGGAIAVFRDTDPFSRLEHILNKQEREPNHRQLGRLVRLALAKSCSSTVALRFASHNAGDAISDRIRKVAGIDDVSAAGVLGCSASPATIANVTATISSFDMRRWRRRREIADKLRQSLPKKALVEASAADNSWIFPVFSRAPEKLIAVLRRHDFDAARMAKTRAIGGANSTAAQAALALSKLVLLPLDSRMRDAEIDLLIALVQEHLAS